MNRTVSLLLLLPVPWLGACAPLQRPLGAAVLGAGGGYLGHQLSDGNPAATAGGAVGGIAVSEGLFALKRRAERKAYQEGYTRGRGDGVKSLYWGLVDRQRLPPAAPAVRLLPVTIPEHVEEGALVQPTTRLLRIQE